MTAPGVLPDRRSAASVALLPPALVFADTPSRVIANVLDSSLIGVANAIPFGLLGLTSMRYPTFMDRTGFAAATLFALVISGSYFVWFWSGGRRATPGQRLLGIQVANAFDGAPLTTTQAVKRFLGLGTWIGIPVALPFMTLALASGAVELAYAVALFGSIVMSPTKQGFHDRWAGSAVVRPADAERTWPRRLVYVGLAIVGFYALIFLVTFVGPSSRYLPDDFWTDYLHWLWPS